MQSHAARDRRSTPRFAAQLEVRFGEQGLDRLAPVGNISEGGLFIQTNEIYKTGTRLWLSIELGDTTVQLTGEVMWAIRVPEHQTDYMEHGMGVQLLDAGPDWRKTFASWRDQTEREEVP